MPHSRSGTIIGADDNISEFNKWKSHLSLFKSKKIKNRIERFSDKNW